MRAIGILLGAALLLGTGTAFGQTRGAATPAAPAARAATPDPETSPPRQLTAQQQRMVDCNGGARRRSLTGDERRTFMSDCLAGRVPPTGGAAPRVSAAQQAQRDRMTTCNADAGQRRLAGAERQQFMRTCLSAN